MNELLLALNAGSSSFKFAVFERPVRAALARGEVSGLGHAPHWRATQGGRSETRALGAGVTIEAALALALDWVEAQFGLERVAAVGHRIVHGGTQFRRAQWLDAAALEALEALDPLAPQHQPHNLRAVRIASARLPAAPAIGCFDTAFHGAWDDAAARLALPRALHEAGVRRYGFHGLSYEYLAGRLRAAAPQARRAVLAHLGSGASLCALRDGRSIDCTMGFSVLDGLPMATRCGAIDPGVVFHLHRVHGLDFDAIEHLLYYDSGLKGISGLSADLRDLLASSAPAARQAVDLFAYHCRRGIGAMAAALGGIDALVFSGGIGARSAALRAAVCAELGFLGVALDAGANTSGAARIDAGALPVFAWETDEEHTIAAQSEAVLGDA